MDGRRLVAIAILIVAAAAGLVLWFRSRQREFDDIPAEEITMTTGTTGIQQLARAIGFAEGYGKPGAVPTRSNNPGDLIVPRWPGATTGPEGQTVFPTPEAGWQALYAQLDYIRRRRSRWYVPEMSIEQMGARWASPATAAAWASNVSTWLRIHEGRNVTPASPIGELLA